MAKKGARRNPKSVVLLTAFNEEGEIVLEQKLKYFDYYEELHPIIDDDGFRFERKIRFIEGKIYDLDRKLCQEFRTEYDENGKYVRMRAVHADGTIIED